MAFIPLDEYSECNLPAIGIISKYTICHNVSKYRPYDVSGLKDAVTTAIDSAINDVELCNKGLNNDIESLSDAWGEKYIKIDGNGLDFVNVDEFRGNFKLIVKSLEEQKTRCNEIVNAIISKTKEVNDYLDKIISNNTDYKKIKDSLEECKDNLSNLKSLYNNENAKVDKDYDYLRSLSQKISTMNNKITLLKNEVKIYEENKLDSPDGSWVLK